MLSFGLVGTGQWARVHAASLLSHPYAELRGVYSRDATRRQLFAAQHGIRPFDSYGSLLADCDAVAFAVDPRVQAALAREAALRGRALLLEKPIAIDVREAELLAATVKDLAVPAVVFFSRLFEADSHAFLAEQRDKVGNGIASMQVEIFTDGASRPEIGSGWRAEFGARWVIAPHALSVADFILGPTATARGTVDDHAFTLVSRHPGGEACIRVSINAALGEFAERWVFRDADGVESNHTRARRSAHAAYQAMLDELMSPHGRTPIADIQTGARITRILADAIDE